MDILQVGFFFFFEFVWDVWGKNIKNFWGFNVSWGWFLGSVQMKQSYVFFGNDSTVYLG